jgi:signal transduction histidine kinase
VALALAQQVVLALALAQQVTLAWQLQRLAAQTEHQAITNERNRMAREMHDTLAQGFAGIVVQLEAADDAIGDDADAARAHVERARTLALTSWTEARHAVWVLRPHLLEARNRPYVLRAATLAIMDGTALHVDVDLQAAVPPLRPETETALLRIAQEAVTNAVKHADATTLHVVLARQNGHVELADTDNGHGFDPAVARPPAVGGFGLIGMHERAARIGGQVDVCSAPGHGTTIKATVLAA